MLDTTPPEPPQRIYLNVEEVAACLGVSTDTIWRMKREGRFPKAKKFGSRITRWHLADLEAWEEAQMTCFATHLTFPTDH
jgi:prophage regulatory protein